MGRAVADVAAKPDTIVASVGDEPITAREVERLFSKAIGKRQIGSAAAPYLRAQILEEIIARRLVLAYAQRSGEAASNADLATAQADLTKQLAAQRHTLDDFLAAQNITAADLRRQLAWNSVWQKYLGRYATPTRQQAYFQAHQHELDGSELLVSQIFWRISPGNDPAAIEALLKKAADVRNQILAGKIAFAAAAQRYSESPSRQDGGRLGWIGRHGPMDETFSRAAFALTKGQITTPFRSSLGVHLIHCDDLRPGHKQLAEASGPIQTALGRELLEKLSRVERARTAVRYTGAMPYFKPGTRELMPH